MSESEIAAKQANVAGRGRLFSLPRIIAGVILLLVLAGAGGGAWYFLLREPAGAAHDKVVTNDPPLPSYFEIKPFVVSMATNADIPHFVQLGFNLTLSDAAAGSAIVAVLPELQDAIRQTLLGFKVDDTVTPAGINKMRAAVLASVNQVLLQRLGADRVKRLSGGEAQGGIVQNVFFSTLIVE
jgi:flagellar FliL protein